MEKKKKNLVRETQDGIEEVRCPNCGQWQPTETYRMYTLNPQFVSQLTPVIQCQRLIDDSRACMHIFAPTELAIKMRQKLLNGVKEEK